MRSLLLGLLLVWGAVCPLSARVQALPQPAVQQEEDGPYVLWEGREARVLRVSGGRAVETRLRRPWRLTLPDGQRQALSPEPPAPARARWPAPERIAALSDIHGNFQGMKALLRAQGVLSARDAWTFGKGHLVVVGDVLDRGAECIEALWLLRGLEAQAARAGGRVHLLLGNHELMVLGGRLRYVNPKYERTRALLGRDLQGLLGPDTELGRWLRSRPALLKLGDTLFVHGGISAELLQGGGDLEGLNAGMRKALDGADEPGRRFAGPGGPLWYRGLMPGADPQRPVSSAADVEAVLRAFGVARVVVGHTTLKAITPFHEGRVVGIDAGLKDGRPGELLLLEKARPRRGLADGRRLDLEAWKDAGGPFTD